MTRAEKTAVAAGRVALAAWLAKAKAHGTVYYTIPHRARSGMSRRITLHTIVMTDDKPEIIALMPWYQSSDNADRAAVARDWSYSLKHGAFVAGGCGMDMVFHLVYTLAGISGCDPSYANVVKRVSLV